MPGAPVSSIMRAEESCEPGSCLVTPLFSNHRCSGARNGAAYLVPAPPGSTRPTASSVPGDVQQRRLRLSLGMRERPPGATHPALEYTRPATREELSSKGLS
jgi:hypothetical protein